MKKLTKYVLVAAALLIPVAGLAASVAGDCECPCCPVKAKK
jgi:hypothetical protein